MYNDIQHVNTSACHFPKQPNKELRTKQVFTLCDNSNKSHNKKPTKTPPTQITNKSSDGY
jgi:hypothetical protein